MNIIDISRDALKTEIYPGDPLPHAEFVSRIGENSSCNLSTLFSCVHTGTHADAPLHFIDGGASIDEVPLEPFIGPCTVIEVPEGAITGEDINEKFRRNASAYHKGRRQGFFHSSAADELADIGLKLIGTDSLSVGVKGDQVAPHKAFLGAGICVLEGLDLSEVTPGNYYLFAAPVKLGGSHLRTRARSSATIFFGAAVDAVPYLQ